MLTDFSLSDSSLDPVTTAPTLDPLPFDPLDPTIDFEQPYERDPVEPGEPVKHQAAAAPALDTEQVSGGGHSVDSYAERNRIPELHRKEGITVCYVRPDQSHWILQGGIGNEHWIAWREGSFTGGGGSPVVLRGGNANPMNFAPEARWLMK